MYGRSVKIHDQFEFPLTIDLSNFLARDADHTQAAVYDLYGVLVHSGGSVGGHHSAFLGSTEAEDGCEFNDPSVTHATVEKAVNANFGGSSALSRSTCLLVYVRKEDARLIFSPVDKPVIPEHVVDCVNRRDTSQQKTGLGNLCVEFAPEECIRQNYAQGRRWVWIQSIA
jgi:hypothetical protein